MSYGVHLAAILDFVICELRKLIISITFEPSQARIQWGGGKGGLAPPPPISGEKNKGTKRSKSDNHEAKYRLKRTPKHTKYAQIC